MASEGNIHDKIKLEPHTEDKHNHTILFNLLKQSLPKKTNSDNVPGRNLNQIINGKSLDFKDIGGYEADATLNKPEPIMVKIGTNLKFYPCDQCDKSFKTKQAKYAHSILHTGNYYKCDVCHRRFISKYRFIVHKRIHTDNISLKCELCGKEFQTQLSLKYHLETHEPVPKYKCDLCGKQFSNRYGFNAHKRFHDRKITEQHCKICNKIIRSYNPSALKMHMARHRMDRGHKCDHCGKVFKSKPVFKKHLQVHAGIFEFKCDLCTKHFTSKSSLQDHIRLVHTTNKPYSCEFCGKRFAVRSMWYHHGRVHARENPYTCTVCEKKFGYPRHLRGHMKAAHGIVDVPETITKLEEKVSPSRDDQLGLEDTKIDIVEHSLNIKIEPSSNLEDGSSKAYACDRCERVFKSEKGLDAHLVQHSGDYFKCEDCGKQFISKERFREHKRIHTDNISLKCEICGKEFQTVRSITYHRETHEKEPKYKCRLCEKQFRNRYAFEGHLRVHAGKKTEQTCEICHKTIRSYNVNALEKHMNMNKHKRLRDHECPTCWKMYKGKAALQEHFKEAHDGPLKFNCKLCPKYYKDRSGLNVHIRSVHNPDRPYSCEICFKTFALKSGWYRHGLMHAKRNPLYCTICNRKYGYQTQLEAHMKTVHTDEPIQEDTDCGNVKREPSPSTSILFNLLSKSTAPDEEEDSKIDIVEHNLIEQSPDIKQEPDSELEIKQK